MNPNDPNMPGPEKPEKAGSMPPTQPGDEPAGSSQEQGQPLDETTDHVSGEAAVPGSVEGMMLARAFGRYQVRGVLGRGGFGIVCLGHDTQLDRLVAIKVLQNRPGEAAEETERFLREARRAARLRHPGIVTVHDVGVQDGQVYIVADYIKGTSLRDWLNAGRPPWQEAARITAALADALAHSHAQLTLHRDVKPRNIILTPELQPVLVDFGLGIDESDAELDLGTVAGTPMYMSPEQIAGKAHRIDGRTDIFSLGVLLYEMLCGHLPFRAADRHALARQICEDDPQPPRQLVRDIPRELERICLKAMAKSIQDRYSTAADLADELRALLAQPRGIPAEPTVNLPAETLPASTAVTPASARHGEDTPSSSRRTREAERRQITILVCGCGLFDSEEFLQNLDTEDQAKVVHAFQQACEQVVTRFDGTIVHLTAEGLIVCFGYPTAHEDAARRAARAGQAILRDVKAINQQLKRQLRAELNPWIGIHTGQAVVEMTEAGITIVGEARNVAVRFEDFGESGQIICSGASQRLLGGFFECEPIGSQKIKGVAAPVEMYRVQGESKALSPIDVKAPAGLTPLTGRDHEVRLLEDRWEQAQEGMGQVVLIIGEAGLGKSRLVHTIKQHVQERQGSAGEGDSAFSSHRASASAAAKHRAPAIEWRCSPHHQNSSLYPAVDFFERFLGFGREEPPPERFAKLVKHLEEYGLAEPELVPVFASLLSLPLDGRFAPLTLAPVRLKEETLKALQEWLRAFARRQPALFIVEDLHWVDPSTLEFLGHFLAEGLHDSVLTLLTFRPEFKTPWPAVAHQTSLALNRLTRRQVADLMRKKTGIETISQAAADQLYERTGGVPLFVEEFTRMIQEAGALSAGEDSKRGMGLDVHAIPATLQDLLMDRLDRMDSNREAVQLAATLGREFNYEILAAVSPLDEAALQAELAKLVQAEVLYQKGRLPRCTYIFKHALLEDAAYNSMVKDKRQQFHQRIATVLESRFPQTAASQPELLAHHFTEAGLSRQAIGYWLKAGLRSRERSADVEAIDHLTKGLELIELIEPGPERDALELQFQIPLGTAYLAIRGYAAPEVGPVFRRARELCERAGQPAQLFAVMWGTWAWHVVRGDFRRCMDLGAEAMELAARISDDGITMEALFLPGLTLLYRGDFTGSRDYCRKALATYDDRARTKFWAAHTGQDSGVTHRCYLALALWHLGCPDQALAMSRELVALARQAGHPFSLGYALHHTGWLLQHCRLGAGTQEAGEECHQMAAEQGFTMWNVTGTLYRAAGMLLQGRQQDALRPFELALDAYRATRAGLALPYYLSILGEAYLRAGKFEEALKALEEGLAIAEKYDDRFQEAEMHRLLGELLLARSPDSHAPAQAYFETSLAIARRQKSKAWELRTTISLAQLLRKQERRAEARQRLAEVYNGYTEGFDTPDLTDARKLLDSLA